MLQIRRLVVVALALASLDARRADAVGGQFGMKFAIDAPWRLEPVPASGGGVEYGPIPIVVTFQDAVFEAERSFVARFGFPAISVGRLREVQVIEWTQDQPHPRQPVTTVPPRALREIERKALVSTRTAEPPRAVCRPSLGEDCPALLDITNTHEWHAMFWYTPKAPITPGRNIHLEVTVVTDYPKPIVSGPHSVTTVQETRRWKNYLVVHAGEAPLPRFSDSWLYGDFHYHAQMTDNEGESGYAYRNVARALGALGMDFVFATDHASNGVQKDGRITRQRCADGSGSSCYEARDLNPARFAAAKAILYGPDGANEAVIRDADLGGLARLRAAKIVPQVYLGEELDAKSEISAAEQKDGVIYFGDRLKYPWPTPNNCVALNGLTKCRRKYSKAAGPDGRSYFVLDEQGIPVEEKIDEYVDNGVFNSLLKAITPDRTRPGPSRQHIVYFPFSATLNREGWIGSDTDEFGGARKSLTSVAREIERGGVGFLAHPLTERSPDGPGPNVVPYSELALVQAWRSPGILGLQFWNENDRWVSAPDRRNPTVMTVRSPDGEERTTSFELRLPFQGANSGSYPWRWTRARIPPPVLADLYHSAYTWDRMLRKGLDPRETSGLSWLERGEPRKWYAAAGSDAHGDFAYRRYGRPCVDRWCEAPIGDTAIGNPRNLVSMTRPQAGPPSAAMPAESLGGPVRYGNRQVIEAVRSGQFSITDGPVVRIVADVNRNGSIDDADVPMGGTVTFYPKEHLPLLVEWLSTPEFGPVSQVDLYVGSVEHTYAPMRHGPTLPAGDGRNIEHGSYEPDPSGALQFVRGGGDDKYHGILKVFLGPAQFGLASSDGSLSYVRAFVKTSNLPSNEAGGQVTNRFGYSNPIWAKFLAECPRDVGPRPLETPFPTSSRRSLDGDGNGIPDTCERSIPDPCRVTPTKGPKVLSINDRPDNAPSGQRPDVADVRPGTGASSGGGPPVPSKSCRMLAVGR